jgi:carbamoyltransferase
MRFPDSLGLLYSTFTSYLGFRVNDAEYKVMGLAPYGKPAYYDLMKKKLLKINEDGSIRLDLSYFSFQYGRRMFNKKFEALLECLRGYLNHPDRHTLRHCYEPPEGDRRGDFEYGKACQQKTGQKNLCSQAGWR